MFESGLPLHEELERSLAYAMETRGKELRLRITLACCNVLRIPENMGLLAAEAIEKFHLASLIFDDMPCMDDASMRRGHACLHTVYGEEISTLTALGLIHESYMNLWEFSLLSGRAYAPGILRLVNDCLGCKGIINGQMWDLKPRGMEHNPEAVRQIARLKTGSLLRLCLLLPALAKGENADALAALEIVASRWAEAYQGVDDLVDTGDLESVEGKDKEQDVAKGRPNLGFSLGSESAIECVRGLLDESLEAITALEEQRSGWRVLREIQAEIVSKLEAKTGCQLAA